jgi:hypothetical protein
MPSTSTLRKADAPRLPCPAHALGHGLDGGALVASEVHAEPASETGEAWPPETYQADRAFHAMLARLTAGIFVPLTSPALRASRKPRSPSATGAFRAWA